MAKVILRQKAIDDLNEIWDYTYETWSSYQADSYYAELEKACNELGQEPKAGRNYEGINKKILGLKSGKHIIFYQSISEDRIEVVRILHERMDLKNRINE